MRVGVGLLGIGLMSFGTLEIIGALKGGESATEIVQNQLPASKMGGGSKPAPKKGEKEGEAQPKEATESEGASEAGGVASEAGGAAEMAAVAA